MKLMGGAVKFMGEGYEIDGGAGYVMDGRGAMKLMGGTYEMDGGGV